MKSENSNKPQHIWVIEVTWKRRKGQPTEQVGICTGGALQAILMAQECARHLKIPQSWAEPVIYERKRTNGQ